MELISKSIPFLFGIFKKNAYILYSN